jgi:hypothetical protein
MGAASGTAHVDTKTFRTRHRVSGRRAAKTQRDVVNHVVARFFPGGRPALFERAARRLNG